MNRIPIQPYPTVTHAILAVQLMPHPEPITRHSEQSERESRQADRSQDDTDKDNDSR